MIEKIEFVVLLLVYLVVPGWLFLAWLNPRKMHLDFFQRVTIIIPTSIMLVAILASFLSYFGIFFVNNFGVLLLMLGLLGINIGKYRKRIIYEILNYFHTTSQNWWLFLGVMTLGIITSSVIYWGFSRQAINPFGEDALDHQLIVERIAKKRECFA